MDTRGKLASRIKKQKEIETSVRPQVSEAVLAFLFFLFILGASCLWYLGLIDAITNYIGYNKFNT